MSDSVVLELRQVLKRFGETTAVDSVNFSIQHGEVFTLLGPSGCGKSTSLRLVAGLEQPDAGEILLNGRVISSSRSGVHLPPEQRNMGMVFQSYAIWPHMTVLQNVVFPLRMRRVAKDVARRRALEVLDIVGLEGLETRPATNLSGGQQQRVALARALVHSPEILLLDEPLSNLDARLRDHMRSEIRQLQRRLGIAVLFVTHDQAEAMTLSDRVAVMNQGHVEQLGTPREVYERPSTPFVRDFLGRAVVLEGTLRRCASAATVKLVDEGGAALTFDDDTVANFTDGASVVVACRPEDVRLVAPGSDELTSRPNRVGACVAEQAYLGERLEYTLRTRGGRILIVFGSRRDPYPVGTNLELDIDTQGATVWLA